MAARRLHAGWGRLRNRAARERSGDAGESALQTAAPLCALACVCARARARAVLLSRGGGRRLRAVGDAHDARGADLVLVAGAEVVAQLDEAAVALGARVHVRLRGLLVQRVALAVALAAVRVAALRHGHEPR